MLLSLSAAVFLTSVFVAGQRPFFAGTRPIGFPDTPNRTTTTPDPLDNRFGEGQKLPIEANGDRDLIDRLSKLPIDKQPFWFINWQALEEHRKNPQSYPQKPSVFVDPIVPSNTGSTSNRFSTQNPAFINTNVPNPVPNRVLSAASSSVANANSNSGLGNRNVAQATAESSASQNVGISNRNPEYYQQNVNIQKPSG